VIHWNGGDPFCRDMTATLRYHKPAAIQIAEYWEWDAAKPVEPGGLGFDASWNDRLRKAIRGVLGAAAAGSSAYVNLNPLHDALYRPEAFPAA
jgi:1,4-alpha-glucan branching enzyme